MSKCIIIDGHSVTIRPMHPSDIDMEADFVRNLSDETKHYRFLGGVRELSATELGRLCDIDGQHSMAFVATVQKGGREVQVGVSRYAEGQTRTSGRWQSPWLTNGNTRDSASSSRPN